MPTDHATLDRLRAERDRLRKVYHRLMNDPNTGLVEGLYASYASARASAVYDVHVFVETVL